MPQAPPTGTVTFLFTDIEGSTQRWQQFPAAMPAAVARHDALLREAIEACGGYVFKTVGDAFCVAFATAPQALAAALAAQRALAAEPWGETGPIRARMALHVGAAEERDNDYFGPAVNRVARLLSAGYGGQTLLSLAAQELVHDALPVDVRLRDLGEHRLKDLARPERIFQVVVPDLPTDFPELKTLDLRPNNLPSQLTPLVGREREVAMARELMLRPDVRLLTLTGPGGTGKTRLALQTATELVESFADGVFFVALAPVSAAEQVASAIAQALAVREAPGHPLAETLNEFLRPRHLLLLLDNFEQVTGAAPLVAELLRACPQLKALVTSRAALRVSGERELAVPPLGLPDQRSLPPVAELMRYEAVRLFVERAQAVKADFAVTADNAPAVAEICRRLDGLPLAIELAAARVKLLPPRALLGRLESRLTVLTGGARDLPARHQTLRSAIAWSHDLLDDDERMLFRRLSAFVGGCSFEAAEAVCNPDGALDALSGLASLVDESLVRQTEQADGEPRFGMLETIHEYAVEQFEASGEAPAMRQAHATYYLALAMEAKPELKGPKQKIWLARLDTERANLGAALGWFVEQGAVETAVRLGGALWLFWARRGYLNEGWSWLERALQRSDDVPPEVRATGLSSLGNIACDLDDYDRARDLYESSLAIGRTLGNQRGVAVALNGLGRVAFNQGNYEQARARYEECRAILEELGNQRLVAIVLNNLGDVAGAEGDYGRARELHEAALTKLGALGDHGSLAWSFLKLGRVACGEGDLTQARDHLEESLRHAEEVGDHPAIAFGLHGLGVVASREGKSREAATRYRASLALWRELGERLGSVECLEGLAGVALDQGQPERAARFLAAASVQRDALSTPLPPADRAGHDRILTAARRVLGNAVFDAAWSAGQRLSLEEAIAEADGDHPDG